MKSNIICIYPEDETTNFLLPIYECLNNLPNFVGYRNNTTSPDNTRQIVDALTKADLSSIVVFLGHGASSKLYGSIYPNGTKHVLLDDSHIELFSNFNTICVSCRSAEYLKESSGTYIGFGDITSDFSEVIATRQFEDADYLNWASEEDIHMFRTLLVEALVKAINYTKCSNISSIFRITELYINKTITQLLLDKKIPNYRHIANMFYNLLEDMVCVLNDKHVYSSVQ